jgi:thioredoxin reductase
MKNFLILSFSVLLLISCQNKQTEKTEDKEACANDSVNEKKFEMYEMSEMASLMEQMYSHNQQLRLRIIKGDTVGKFPEFFNKIYTAKFTTPSDNDAFFKENADKYIAAQKLIYSETENVKENFNKGVDACITCHKGKCGGPIPRIKKLYIK